jgi:beta-mannosidase
MTVGAINPTKVFDVYTKNLTFSLNDGVLFLSISVPIDGVVPNSDTKQTYTHTNWMSPVPLSQANLKDPELSLSYDKTTGLFTVESKAVVAWTRLDHPADVMGHFDDNGFLMLHGSKKEVSFVVDSDESKGHWVDAVTVGSIWNNTIIES